MPNGTIGARACAHSLTMAATSSVDLGKDDDIRKSRLVPRLAMAVVFAHGLAGRDPIAKNAPQLINDERGGRRPHVESMDQASEEECLRGDLVGGRGYNSPSPGPFMPTPMFTPKTLSFLRSLKRNNKREWFHARKDQYEPHCRGPMTAIVEQLAVDFRSFAPEMLADPKVSLFRQFRDTRFSEDKTPLKTTSRPTFPDRALGRMNGAGFYFEVAPGLGVDRRRLCGARMRRSCSWCASTSSANHKRSDAIVGSTAFKKIGGLQGDRLTRVPRGFAKDHPAADYLQFKQFMGFA